MECVSRPSIIAIGNALLMGSAKKNALEMRTISVVKTYKLFLLVVFNYYQYF